MMNDGRALILLLLAFLLGVPCAVADEVPVLIIKPIINAPQSGGAPGATCPGFTCWSAMMPPVASGRVSGLNQTAFDNAFVGYSNWSMQNTLKIYTSDQVDAMMNALRKEYEKKEQDFERKIINEIDARLPKTDVSPSK